MSSERNRTVTLSDSERLRLQKRIISETELPDRIPLDSVVNAELLAAVKRIPRESMDLLIADPPYNLAKKFASTRFGEMSDGEYIEYTAEWLDAVLSLLKPTASVYICCDWRSSTAIYSVLRERLKVRNRITWQREKGRGAAKNWKNGMEDIWFATVSDEYTFELEAVKQRRRVIAPYRNGNGAARDWQATENGKFRDTCPSNFWDDISVPYWSMPENTEHPTQKPEKLMAKLILASSVSGASVLDLFSGSGTASVVAKKLDRHYIAVEREAEYCALAAKRLEYAEHSREIQGYTDGVFWERNTAALQRKFSKQK